METLSMVHVQCWCVWITLEVWNRLRREWTLCLSLISHLYLYTRYSACIPSQSASVQSDRNSYWCENTEHWTTAQHKQRSVPTVFVTRKDLIFVDEFVIVNILRPACLIHLLLHLLLSPRLGYIKRFVRIDRQEKDRRENFRERYEEVKSDLIIQKGINTEMYIDMDTDINVPWCRDGGDWEGFSARKGRLCRRSRLSKGKYINQETT